MTGFDLATCARPNILALEPYRCARDDYNVSGVLLDANENTHGAGLPTGAAAEVVAELNRYPDPRQIEVKQLLCSYRSQQLGVPAGQLVPENIFAGVGSDEAIDMLFRCFCAPGRDKVLICPPTYGMYSVCAQVNDVSVVRVPLRQNDFQLEPEKIIEAVKSDPTIKMVIVCSPGNPTGKCLDMASMEKLLDIPEWNGLVVVDEAYIDFSDIKNTSMLSKVAAGCKNVVVLQTLSKAFGLAGIRFGVAYADTEIIHVMNCVKAPYNVSKLTLQAAADALSPAGLSIVHNNVTRILEQRERLARELPRIAGLGRLVGGLDTNFLMVPVLNAEGEPSNTVAYHVYEELANKHHVVVRFRGKEPGCLGCLRITVGTAAENTALLEKLALVLSQYNGSL